MQKDYPKPSGTGTIVGNATVRVEGPTDELLSDGRELIG